MRTTFRVPVAESKPDPGYELDSTFGAVGMTAPKREFANLALAVKYASSPTPAMQRSEDGSKPSMAQAWQMAADKAAAHEAARRIRWNNKIRALQRTPLHMVMHRMRQLVEKREVLWEAQGGAPRGSVASTARRDSKSPSPRSPLKKHASVVTPRSQGLKNSPRAGHRSSQANGGTGHQASSSGVVMDEESILDELCVTVRFLADFMAKLPTEVCTALCHHIFVETISKDQVLARPGDDVAKFTILVTGVVERADSLRAEGRFNQATCVNLKKGAHFGSDFILKKLKHKHSYCALSSVTVLTIDKEPFRHIYGMYFAERTRLTGNFLHTNVAAFRALGGDTTQMLAEMTEEVKLELGTEFDIYNNESIYILGEKARVNLLIPKLSSLKEKGKASRKNSKARRETMLKVLRLDDEQDENGKYVNIPPDNMPLDVEVGEQMITVHQVIAQLEQGTYFGGGTFIQGEDPLVADIKALAVADSVCFRISRDALRHRIPEEVVQLLRNETAFQLTYYMGRQGVMPEGHVLGHLQASIFDTRLRNSMAVTRFGGHISDQMRTLNANHGGKGQRKQLSAFQAKRKALMATKAEYMRKANEKLPKKAQEAKFVNIMHKDAKFPVGSIMKFKSDTEQEHVAAMGASILTPNGTPVERYWNSSGSTTTHQGKILPVLQTVYPAGLQPLAEKVVRMADLERRRWELGISPYPGAAWGGEAGDSEDEDGEAELRRTIDELDSTRPQESSSPKSRSKGRRSPKRPARQDPLAPAFPPSPGSPVERLGSPLPPRPQTSPAQFPASAAGQPQPGAPRSTPPWSSVGSATGLADATAHGAAGSVRAASYMWDGMKGRRRPHIRQCLTFAEIAKFCGEERRDIKELVQQRSKHDPEIQQLTDWNLSKLLDYNPYDGALQQRPATSGGIR
eukprot:jgi/Tetstr1/422351/TSEL_013192.t1